MAPSGTGDWVRKMVRPLPSTAACLGRGDPRRAQFLDGQGRGGRFGWFWG